MLNLFSSIRDRFSRVSRGINTFSNAAQAIKDRINSFSNSRLVKFLGSDEFGNIVKNGVEFLESKNLITRKTEDKARNLVDLLSELKKGNYANTINYGSSIVSDDFSALPSGHFRETARRRFLDRIRAI